MPLINIYTLEGKSENDLAILGDSIHQSLMETWAIPQDDRFQMIHEMKPAHFNINKKMFGVNRSDDVILLHITSSPRSTTMKLDFYARLPQLLQENLGVRPEDVFISIISNNKEDWSFGNGRAQLLDES